ncbi:MAG: hypothetical protein ACYDAC_06755 [Candidatus Dormibacteria bacterium]
MRPSALAAVTLAAHANGAISAGQRLRLPAHPAFLPVRNARFGGDGGGVDAWFAQAERWGQLQLSDAGLAGPAKIGAAAGAWQVEDSAAGVVLSPAPAVPAAREPLPLDAATRLVGEAAQGAAEAAGAPPDWIEAARRAAAILRSVGTGEELSDVAWPHFLLPAAAPLPAHRLAAAAATLWAWDRPGAWSGVEASAAVARLREPVGAALAAAVAQAWRLSR